MAYKLSALRFRSVGERSARFTDLTLDLTAPGEDGSEPQDSVIWLRNGGGKSSILSLLYAMMLPHANDFMGRSVKRSLTDYIDSGDTAHVVAVWEPAGKARPLLGEVEGLLITGVVHEWEGLRRPAQPEESRDRLNTSFYAFHVIPGVADLTTLPFTDDSGRPRNQAAYLAAVKEQAGPYGQRTGLVITDKQRVWATELLKRHLDPEIFRPQKQMNHVEGGVEDLFKFPSAKEFIDFLLDLTTQPDAADSIAVRLKDVTAKLAAKPEKINEQNFCAAAAGDLDTIAERHRNLRSANEKLEQAKGSAARLAAAFGAAVTFAEQEQTGLQEQEAAIVEARTRANNARSQANDLAYLYRLKAAQLRIAEASGDEHKATQRSEAAAALVRAWEAALRLADKAGKKAELGQAQRAAAAEEAELAPLREEHARHAARLRARLADLAQRADAAAETADEQQGLAEGEAERQRDLAKQARIEQGEAAEEKSKAQAHLDVLGQRRREGVEKGHLPTATTSPQDHLDSVAAEHRGLEGQLADIAVRVEQRRTRRTEIRPRQTELARKQSDADSKRRETAKRRGALEERLSRLTADPRVRELVEASPDETIDLWNEADVLLRRLGDAVLAADEERILRRAEQYADRRTIDAQERSRYLPGSLDAEQVRRALPAHVTAQSGWEYLRSRLPADQLATAVNIPSLARLGCGVVVPTRTVNDSIGHLDAQDITTTSLVGLYSAENADALIQAAQSGIGDAIAPDWASLQPGLVDADAADAAVQLLKERAEAAQAKDQDLARKRNADDALRRQVSEFIEDCPAGHLTVLDDEIERLDRKLKGMADEQEALQNELQDLDDADGQDATSREQLSEQREKLNLTIAWLGDLIPYVQEEGDWKRQLADAAGRVEETGRRAEDHDRKRDDANGEAAGYKAAAAEERRKARDYRTEAGRIPESAEPPEVVVDVSVPLDTLRSNQQQAFQVLDHRASQSVLADRVQRLTGEVADIEADLVAHHSSADRQSGAELLRSPAGQDAGLRSDALNAAREAKSRAEVERGAAKEKMSRCQSELKGIERAGGSPRRALPVVPVIASQADELASEQERLRTEELDRVTEADRLIGEIAEKAGRIATRKKVLSTLLDSLPSASDSASPEPFAGSEDEARDAARKAKNLVDTVIMEVSSATSNLTKAVERLHRTASRFSDISGPIKDRVTHDPSDVLAPNAADLAAKLRLRSTTLAGELESIAKDQAILSEALAHLVKESMDILGKAERSSQMNTASGSWSGRKILRIGFDRPDDAALTAYAERVIDRTVQKGLKPEGMPLLKAAVHEAAGPRGFIVKVLKPTEDTAATTEDISRLAKWSGGEKLTVCVALYCTIAALRAARTGQGPRSGGVLLLDNPIGRASSAPLVRLQRDVAASHGIQLVVTTGVKDPAAVIQFPNVIRLDNREGRTHNRRYIVAEDRGREPSQVTGVRVAHADHPWDIPADSGQVAE